MGGFAGILSTSSNELNKFYNTGAGMQDSIFHKTLKFHLIRDFRINTSRFYHKKTQRFFYRRQHRPLRSNLHI